MAENEERRIATRGPRPFRGIWDLREDMDRLWDNFPIPRFRRLLEEPAWPAVDVFERDGSVVVKADVPGMTARDIEVTLTEEGLSISGERSEEKEVKEKDYYRSERSYGRFVRQVRLPAGADRERAEANFKDGVLEIVLPMKVEAQKRTIEVKTSSAGSTETPPA